MRYLNEQDTELLFSIVRRGGVQYPGERRRLRLLCRRLGVSDPQPLNAARAALVESVMDMARKEVASRKASAHVQEDLLGECYVRVLAAVDTYLPSRGAWTTYARLEIRKGIEAAEAEASYGGTLPGKAVLDVHVREHRGVEHMAYLSEESADKAANMMFGTVSYSAVTTEEGDPLDFEDEGADDFQDDCLGAIVAAEGVRELLDVLTPAQRRVIRLKYLGGRTLTDAEVATALGKSRQSVSESVQRALVRLADAATERGLV